MCQDTTLECKEPGLKPLSCVVPLYDGLVAGLDVGKVGKVTLYCTGVVWPQARVPQQS